MMPHATPPPFRIGHGYDIHRFAPAGTTARPLTLAGVPVPHDRDVVAHSDGDAVLHAVTDAVLGALALPDLGSLFPDNAPDNDGRASADFLARALEMAAQAGYAVVNLDVTVIAERPKIAPIRDTLRLNLARLVGVPIERVNIKGKTHERLDAIGQGDAIEVYAVALMSLA